jgi:hemerythrin-like domain-containing protein
MDALQMLREDHRRVKELFRQFEEAEDKATKQAAAETALVELNIHAVLEEEIFYPAFRRQGNGSGEIVERAEQEHHTAEQLMDELMKMEPGNQEFDAKFHVLIENVKSHIDEEEAGMLPQAAEAGMARLEQLGERMEQRRQQLMSEGGNGRQRTRAVTKTRSRSPSGARSRASSGARTKSGTRSRTRASSGAKASSGTRTRSTAKNGSRASGTRSRAGSTTRSRVTSGTASRSGASGASRTKAQRSSSSGRTVKQAGGSRTTRTRSNTGGRRSGSQSGK